MEIEVEYKVGDIVWVSMSEGLHKGYFATDTYGTVIPLKEAYDLVQKGLKEVGTTVEELSEKNINDYIGVKSMHGGIGLVHRSSLRLVNAEEEVQRLAKEKEKTIRGIIETLEEKVKWLMEKEPRLDRSKLVAYRLFYPLSNDFSILIKARPIEQSDSITPVEKLDNLSESDN